MKPRLFVLGDSFAYNYFSKTPSEYRKEILVHMSNPFVERFVDRHNNVGHWTDYFVDNYEIQNFAEPGCSNEDIVYQFGLIPDYKLGDRIITIFTNPNRFVWYTEESVKHVISIWTHYQKMRDKYYENVLNEQLVFRACDWNWDNGRVVEKKFITNLTKLYREFSPLFLSWDIDFKNAFDFIHFIPQTGNWKTISQETKGFDSDSHFGINGNYELAKMIYEILEIKDWDLPKIMIEKNMI